MFLWTLSYMMIAFKSIKKYNSSSPQHKDGSLHVMIFNNSNVYDKFVEQKNINPRPFVIAPHIQSYYVNTTKDTKLIMAVVENQLNIIDVCKFIISKLPEKKTCYMVMRYAGEMREPFVVNFFKMNYSFVKYKTTNKKENAQHAPLVLVDSSKMKNVYNDLIAKIRVTNVANNLANEPANRLYPQLFCDAVSKLFKPYMKEVEIKVLGVDEIKAQKLNLIHSVGMGAKHGPRFMILKLNSPKKSAQNVCILGKGVVFDSGGYDIKPPTSMISMKDDKTGASIAIGIMLYMAQFKQELTHNIIAVIPLVENLVSGSAYKPGDIITSYNGKTVEIANTDAEGRLILADALAYSCKNFDPAYIIDFATLTGWSQLMHCDTSFVCFTLNDALADLVSRSAETMGERFVRMPSWVEYIRYTKSTVADVKNANYACSKSDGFMASLFMLNFINKQHWNNWIHFDVTHVVRSDGVINANSIATGINLVKSLVL